MQVLNNTGTMDTQQEECVQAMVYSSMPEEYTEYLNAYLNINLYKSLLTD